MEIRHPVERSFGCTFPAICNHCIVMAAWSRKTFKFCETFVHFVSKKRPVTVKFSKFYSESFHRDTDRRCCVQMSWNLADGKSAKFCVIYLTKNNKISPASQTVAIARIALSICQGQGQPQQCTQSFPDFIQNGSLVIRASPFTFCNRCYQ